jgi:hypothetical protein
VHTRGDGDGIQTLLLGLERPEGMVGMTGTADKTADMRWLPKRFRSEGGFGRCTAIGREVLGGSAE